MADKSKPQPTPRGRTIPAPQWWLDLLNEAVEAKGDKQVAISRMLAEREIVAHPSTISRFLDGTRTTMKVIEALSDIYEIPPPFFIAETVEDAKAMQAQPLLRELRARRRAEVVARQDAKAARIAAGVPEKPKRDQGDPLQPVHASSDRRGTAKPGRVGPSGSRSTSR